MNVLYIVGNGSKHDNIELRWSLRSLEKYGVGVDNVIVSGTPPDWLSDSVIKIENDPSGWLQQKKMISNVMAAFNAGVLGDEFVLEADDHFIVREIDFDSHPSYICGELPYKIDLKEVHKEYKMGLVFSRWTLGNLGMPTHNTSNHVGVPVVSSLLKDWRIVGPLVDKEYRSNVWAILGNASIYEYGESRTEKYRDIKVESPLSYDEIIDVIGDNRTFSVGDGAFDGDGIMSIMEREFSKKSVFEK